MSSGERNKPANRSIEDWLAQKLAADLAGDDEEDDTEPEPSPSPELPPLPEDLGAPIEDVEQTMQATVDATLPVDLGHDLDDPEHTRESVVEPSVPIPWPDWEPEPFPVFDADAPAVREPSLPIPGGLSDPLTPPPWEGDTDPEHTVDLLADEASAPLGPPPDPVVPSFPPWESDTEPESTSTLLRDDTPRPVPPRGTRPPPPAPRPAPPPPPPPRPKVPEPSPVRQLAPAPSRTPTPAPGRPVAQRGRVSPVADPRPTTRPPPPPVHTQAQGPTWGGEEDPELSFPGVEINSRSEPEIEDLEPAPHGNFDEVFPPPRRPGSLEEWGPTAIGRTAGGTPRDPPTVREEDPDAGGLTAPRSYRRASDEATDVRGFTAPAPPDSFLLDEQPTVIIRPSAQSQEPPPPAPAPPPLAHEDDYMTTLLAWTGASVGIIAFILIVGVTVVVAKTMGWIEF